MAKQRRPDEPCEFYCCSRFKHFEEPEADYTADLKNAIHPLFKTNKITSTSSLVDYDPELVTESTRLATRLLDVQTLRKHILTIAQGDVHYVKDDPRYLRRGPKVDRADAAQANWPLFVYPKPEQKKGGGFGIEIEKLLIDLSRMVQFEFADTLSLPGAAGVCMVREGPLPVDLDSSFPFGRMSLIQLDAKTLTTIRSWKDRLAQGESWEFELRFAQLGLTQLMWHEIGHAIVNATFGSCWHSEPISNSACGGEAGFDLEASIFGGLLGKMLGLPVPEGGHTDYMYDDIMVSPLVMEPWPSSSMLCRYMNDEYCCGVLLKPSAFTEVSRVPQKFVADLFHEDFWRKRDPKASLRPSNMPSWILGRDKFEFDSLMRRTWHQNDYDDSQTTPESTRVDNKVDQNGGDSATVCKDKFAADPVQGDDEMKSQSPAYYESDPSGKNDYQTQKSSYNPSYRLIESYDEDLDNVIIQRLRDIVRRQWDDRLSTDPLEVLDTAVWPWNEKTEEDERVWDPMIMLWYDTRTPGATAEDRQKIEDERRAILEAENVPNSSWGQC